MKKVHLIYALLPLLAFTSCKKDAKQPTPTPPKTPEISAVSDSVSYTIDGKTYAAGGLGLNMESSGGADANRQLIFTNENNIPGYSLVGKQDSIMYSQQNTIYTKDVSISIFFLRKCARPKQGLWWMAGKTDALKLFTIGKYNFAEDFGWQNSQNGVAINLSAGDNGYTSYDAYNGVETIKIAPGFQKNSALEITSFKETTNGEGYNLEAKFSAVVFDSTGQQKPVAGYLRLNFDISYNALAD